MKKHFLVSPYENRYKKDKGKPEDRKKRHFFIYWGPTKDDIF